MRKLILGLVFLFSANSFADKVECTISSGKKSSTASFDLENKDEDYAIGENVYDLSFNLTVECKSKSCTGSITIMSDIIEDELASTGFEFKRSKQVKKVYDEPLENAPDKRPYEMECFYIPTCKCGK